MTRRKGTQAEMYFIAIVSAWLGVACLHCVNMQAAGELEMEAQTSLLPVKLFILSTTVLTQDSHFATEEKNNQTMNPTRITKISTKQKLRASVFSVDSCRTLCLPLPVAEISDQIQQDSIAPCHLQGLHNCLSLTLLGSQKGFAVRQAQNEGQGDLA